MKTQRCSFKTMHETRVISLRLEKSDMDFVKKMARLENKSINMTIRDIIRNSSQALTDTKNMVS